MQNPPDTNSQRDVWEKFWILVYFSDCLQRNFCSLNTVLFPANERKITNKPREQTPNFQNINLRSVTKQAEDPSSHLISPHFMAEPSCPPESFLVEPLGCNQNQDQLGQSTIGNEHGLSKIY